MADDKMYSEKLSEYLKSAKNIISHPALIEQKLEEAWEKAKNLDPQLRELMINVEIFVEIIKAYFKGTYRDVDQKTILFMLAGILYFINPFDIIPDIIPILGFTDDAAVLLFILGKVKAEIDKYLEWKKNEGIRVYEPKS